MARTAEDELIHLRHTNTLLQEQVEAQGETIRVQQAQIAALTKQAQEVQARLAKDSRNSHLPPSSDRFARQPRSLRQKSEHQPGGQAGHAGTTLPLSAQPDEITVHRVQRCQYCQCELHDVDPCSRERRQVVDLPPTRLVVREYQAEQKQCPQCQQTTSADFPPEVRAPVQYGARIGAMAVYLVEQRLQP